MNTKLINRITIKKDGVYVSSKPIGTKSKFHSERNSSLSSIYENRGQVGLDIEVIRLALTGAKLIGNHPSIKRYRHVIDPFIKSEAYSDMQTVIKNNWDKLPEEDKDSIATNYYSDAALAFLSFKNEKINSMASMLSDRIPVNTLNYEFVLYELLENKVVCCSHQIPSFLIPKGLYKYELAYTFISTEYHLLYKDTAPENFCGTIISKKPLFDEDVACVKVKDKEMKDLDMVITLSKYRHLK